ncbi:hypothetical protein THRCLA_07929 [Thraustotheca clavata]|uniref:NadR/Ttd14 AAA domain-containing protein n=1 Tax=Thraustotheca clavata TaxID=74557 RepID=A0A1V9ZBP1_9STRA|nr:hypothetical protein THRCLA_07929 [Thraustotheca clavata]
MLIVCFEGCHGPYLLFEASLNVVIGSGKSSLCKEVNDMGFRVLDENFLDMPAYSLHPQSLFMETKWVCSWFDRVLSLARHERNISRVFFADRSPFSAVFYSANGHLLEPLIRAQMKEIAEFANVQFLTIHVNVERELLWKRIQARLLLEPERIRYMEHKRSKMEDCLAFYNSFKWDLQIENTNGSLHQLAEDVVKKLYDELPIMQLQVQEMANQKDIASEMEQTDSDCESEMTVSCYDESPVKERLQSIKDVEPICMDLDMA